MAEHVLDAKGLNCPLPIIKAKKMLKDVPTGETLRVLSTDPGSVADFAAFCRTTGNELVEFEAGRNDLQLSDQAAVVTANSASASPRANVGASRRTTPARAAFPAPR